MKKRTKKRMDYICGYVQEGDLFMPKRRNKLLVVNFTKRYNNCLHLLADLSGGQRILLDYFTEVMDERNTVYTNRNARDEFSKFVEYVTKGVWVYSDSFVKKGIADLKKQGFLLEGKTRGIAIVNPEYFFNGSEEERMMMVKDLLQKGIMKHYVTKKEMELDQHPMAAPEQEEKASNPKNYIEEMSSYLDNLKI